MVKHILLLYSFFNFPIHYSLVCPRLQASYEPIISPSYSTSFICIKICHQLIWFLAVVFFLFFMTVIIAACGCWLVLSQYLIPMARQSLTFSWAAFWQIPWRARVCLWSTSLCGLSNSWSMFSLCYHVRINWELLSLLINGTFIHGAISS